MKVILGTNNLHKLEEFREIFKQNNINIELISLKELNMKIDEPCEDGKTFYENALIKAKYYYDYYKMPVIADDSGICCNALGGLPGIYSARYASTDGSNSNSIDNLKKLLYDMKNYEDRSAYFECSIVYYDGNEVINGNGKFYGEIMTEEKGSNGFGYDPIFYLKEYGKTVSELDSALKNKLSHRYQAIMDFIKKYQNKTKK